MIVYVASAYTRDWREIVSVHESEVGAKGALDSDRKKHIVKGKLIPHEWEETGNEVLGWECYGKNDMTLRVEVLETQP